MPRQVSRTAYELDELDETARERAREQYKALGVYERWYEDVFEHFTRVCAGLGVEVATRRTQTIGGDEAYELQVRRILGFAMRGLALPDPPTSLERGSSATK